MYVSFWSVGSSVKKAVVVPSSAVFPPPGVPPSAMTFCFSFLFLLFFSLRILTAEDSISAIKLFIMVDQGCPSALNIEVMMSNLSKFLGVFRFFRVFDLTYLSKIWKGDPWALIVLTDKITNILIMK